MQRFLNNIDLSDKLIQGLVGLVTAFMGYFLPIYDMGKFVVWLFIADFIVGVWHSKKNLRIKFSGQKFFGTVIPRMFLSIFLIMALYQWDETYQQNLVSTYKLVAWFISGALIWSIADNSYKITKWGIFMDIVKLLKNKINEQIGRKKNEDN